MQNIQTSTYSRFCKDPLLLLATVVFFGFSQSILIFCFSHFNNACTTVTLSEIITLPMSVILMFIHKVSYFTIGNIVTETLEGVCYPVKNRSIDKSNSVSFKTRSFDYFC